MKTIWKYALDASKNDLHIPVGGKILSIQTQRETPCMWVLVDPESKREVRSFAILGTGWSVDIPDSHNFIGTFQLNGGSLVFHVFEVIK